MATSSMVLTSLITVASLNEFFQLQEEKKYKSYLIGSVTSRISYSKKKENSNSALCPGTTPSMYTLVVVIAHSCLFLGKKLSASWLLSPTKMK